MIYNHSRLVTLKKGFRKVRSEKYILLMPSTDASYWTSKIPCDLMSLDQFMMVTNYMFALPKGTHLTDKISEALLKLQEEGILQRLFHKWWNSEECVGFTDSGYQVHAESNETRSTDAAFMGVRRHTTELPPVLPPENRNPTVSPDRDFDAHLSNIPPIVESVTDEPTIHSNNNKNSDSIVVYSSSSTSSAATVATTTSQTSVHSTTPVQDTTNRRRHNNGRHGNKNENRRRGRLNSDITTTPRFYWGNVDNPERIPDYIEGIEHSTVRSKSPFPNYVVNITVRPLDRFTFRPITYTVPTTLSTITPSNGRNRNRINKNEDNLQENKYKIVDNGSQSQSVCSVVVLTLSVFWCLYL